MILMKCDARPPDGGVEQGVLHHVPWIIAIMAGYGIWRDGRLHATHFGRFRIIVSSSETVTLVPAFITFYNGVSHTFLRDVGLLSYGLILVMFICLAAAFVLAACRAIFHPDPRLPGQSGEATGCISSCLRVPQPFA